jgi:hypothetical protein
LLINNFKDGYAVLSSGPVKLRSEDHHILRFELDTGDNEIQAEQAPAFFWRQQKRPSRVRRLTLGNSAVVDLGEAKGWEGEITEIGFLFMDAGEQVAELGQVSLQADNLQSNIDFALQDWSQFEPWTQASVNFLHGGAAGQKLLLPLVLLAWIFATMLIFWLSGIRSARGLASYGFAILLIAWMILDLRWTANGARQMGDSLASRWASSDHERLLGGLDAQLYPMVRQFQEKIQGEETRRIVIVGDTDRFSYFMMRAKYHLLPDNVLVKQRLTARVSPQTTDYVMFIGDFSSKGTAWNQVWQQLPMHDSWRDSLQLVDSGALGILFSVTHEDP